MYDYSCQSICFERAIDLSHVCHVMHQSIMSVISVILHANIFGIPFQIPKIITRLLLWVLLFYLDVGYPRYVAYKMDV